MIVTRRCWGCNEVFVQELKPGNQQIVYRCEGCRQPGPIKEKKVA
jgi:hypothetical protein